MLHESIGRVFYEIDVCDDLVEVIAKILANETVAENLIEAAKATPYLHLTGYMDRWWLWNGYSSTDYSVPASKPFPKFPSLRIHHILRPDFDPDMHDHPWDARTFILKGWYIEERLVDGKIVRFKRVAGDTATLKYGEFHNIIEVSEGGVWTLFLSYDWHGTWGFLVDGKKVPWTEYKNRSDGQL